MKCVISLTVVLSNVKNYATVKLLKNYHLAIELPTNVSLQYLVGLLPDHNLGKRAYRNTRYF